MGVPPCEEKSAHASTATSAAVRGWESPHCDRWLLAVPELVSMRTIFFFLMGKKTPKLNNSGFIPMWSGKNFEILSIFEGFKTISHPVIATSPIRMCLKPLQQELSRAGLSWIPLSTRNAVVRGHVSSEKKYLQ